jgi:hypothetical protein
MRNKKRLNYTLVSEGYSEYAFIPTYLRRIAEVHNIQIVQSKLDLKKKQPSKSKVLLEARKLCTAAMQEEHDLFIAGIDLDKVDHEPHQPHHIAECAKLSSAMGNVYNLFRDKIIIYVPVQAIEHWLTYQAYNFDSNTFSKCVANSLESKPQDELKKMLYRGKVNGDAMERLAKNIADNADFVELARQSRSFNHFHKQVAAFLSNFIQQNQQET